ncbi:MAG: endonuclease III [FCB group bacterium]|nr:endonuclease III [FCB group bacterium]MBL7027781.1 endonuclease III [Candidatus Neomarinimicrobiota bacterium]MBL7120862.1 endonuclease III [Candidatus Neomarinimicrobiota bacterium]
MRESLKNKQLRMQRIITTLYETYPDSKCSLEHRSPFQLLISTMLSAQCTDERVNKVTPELFKHYPTAQSMASAPVEHLAELVRSTGFFNSKSRNMSACAQTLMQEHEGEVPADLDALVKLPGVGRKTANVVLGTGFHIPGLVVDTHVIRIANLLRMTNQKDAVKIEMELQKIIEKEHWVMFTHLIIDHGRAVCIARRPQCHACVLAEFCPSVLPEEAINRKK